MSRLYRTRFVLDALDAPAATMEEADRGRVGMNISPIMYYHDLSDGAPRETYTCLVERLNAFNLTYLHVAPFGAKVAYRAPLQPRFHGANPVGRGLDQNSGEALLDGGPADAAVFGGRLPRQPGPAQRTHQGATLNTSDQTMFFTPGERGVR